MDRKQFVLKTGASMLAAPALFSFGKNKFQDKEKLDPELVKEFVGKSHRDPDRVKELLEETPTLLNAAHDWGNGDFETGLGAASHVGNKDLVKYFIEKGAQTNLFTAALFGRMDILKPLLDFSPESLNARGPHGFTLLHHAEKGGEQALELKEYLVSLGASETKIALF